MNLGIDRKCISCFNKGTYQIPINIVPRKTLVATKLLCKSSYSFLQPVSQREATADSLPQQYEYHPDQYACSKQCMTNLLDPIFYKTNFLLYEP